MLYQLSYVRSARIAARRRRSGRSEPGLAPAPRRAECPRDEQRGPAPWASGRARQGRWSRLPSLRGGLVVAGRRVGGEVDLKRGIVALTVSRPPAAPSPDSGTPVERAGPVVPGPPTPSTPLASPTPTAAAAPATIPQRAIAEEVAVGLRRAEPVSDTPPQRSARRAAAEPPSPRSACSRSARSRPSSWRFRTTATAARLIAGRSRPRQSRASPVPFRRLRSAARRPRRRRPGAQRRNAPPRGTRTSPRLRPHPHRPPRRLEHHHAGPERARHRLAAATGRRGLLVQLYRQGKLGSRRILEAWPVEPRFTLPRKAPDGSALEPGRYSCSAAPQESRRGRIR